MAGQSYDKSNNRFWIDLHKCATHEAEHNVSSRITECYQYGITEIEIIYGTPDRYEGSIQQMMARIAAVNPLVENMSDFHAGCVLLIKKNPNPTPQDEDMYFGGISANYENWHKMMSYNDDYYPLRTVNSTSEISSKIGCSVEYIRRAAEKLPLNFAEKITEYNELTRRNETSWRIYSKGLDALNKKWKSDKEIIESELRIRDATSNEIESILMKMRTPLDLSKSIKGRISGALSKLRKQQELKNE